MAVDDEYTKVLLHGDGADGSTTIIDEAGATVTVHGDAQIDTAQSVFGGASIKFDGTGDYLTSSPVSAGDFDFGSDSFTVDFRLRSTFPGSSSILVYFYKDSTHFLYIRLSGYTLYYNAFDGTQVFNGASAGGAIMNNTWYHIAFVRNGTSIKLYINGTASGTEVTDSDALCSGITTLYTGCTPAAGELLNGWIDELRVSKGIARWTGNFTPPTAAYAPAGVTKSVPLATIAYTAYPPGFSPVFYKVSAATPIVYSAHAPEFSPKFFAVPLASIAYSALLPSWNTGDQTFVIPMATPIVYTAYPPGLLATIHIPKQNIMYSAYPPYAIGKPIDRQRVKLNVYGKHLILKFENNAAGDGLYLQDMMASLLQYDRELSQKLNMKGNHLSLKIEGSELDYITLIQLGLYEGR